MAFSLRSRLTLGVAIALTVITASACSNSDPLDTGGSGSGPDTVVVGSADFPESETVANIYAEALRANGFDVTTKLGIGSRETYVPAVENGTIDVIPDYTGNLLQFLDKDATATSAADVNAALATALGPNLAVATPAPGENKDSVTVTRATADRWQLTSIADLAPHSAEVTFGAPAEFQERAVGLPGLRENYGLDIAPGNFVPIADGGGPATVRALTDGKVVAANIFTTSPAIAANDLVVLADPKNNFPAQNVVPLLHAQSTSDKITAVLDAVSAKLTTDELVALNEKVSGDSKTEPADAASQWVAAQGLDQPVG
ncbi:ABC transporter substrate-binding protein [Rhodococcus sp. NPDC003348]